MQIAKLFTAEGAADWLSLKPTPLYAWVYQRRIGHVKLGRALRFREKDVEECIQRGTVDVWVA